MLEVFEIYQPPQADRNKIAGKMLGHVLIVFAALAVVMVKLFLCIGADSTRNRDAVRKVTSPETDFSGNGIMGTHRASGICCGSDLSECGRIPAFPKSPQTVYSLGVQWGKTVRGDGKGTICRKVQFSP